MGTGNGIAGSAVCGQNRSCRLIPYNAEKCNDYCMVLHIISCCDKYITMHK